jgi:hypothetical protein
VSTTPTIWYARGGSPLSIRFPMTLGSLGQKVRAIAYRDDAFLRIISLHPDHDSAYGR